MSDLDVALKLKLEYKDKGAKELENDLKSIAKAAKTVSGTKAGTGLEKSLVDASNAADKTRKKISEIKKAADTVSGTKVGTGLEKSLVDASNAADKTRKKISEIKKVADTVDDSAGPKTLKSELDRIWGTADKSEAKIKAVRQAANVLDDTPGPAGLETRIEKVTGAAKEAEAELKKLGKQAKATLAEQTAALNTPKTKPRPSSSTTKEGGFMSEAVREAAIASGGGNLVGSKAAVTGVMAASTIIAIGRSYLKYAGFDRQMNRIGATAGADRRETADATERTKAIAQEIGVPTDVAVEALGTLVGLGKTLPDAVASLRDVINVALASGGSAGEAAFALATARDKMGVSGNQAGDIMLAGGKDGMFEFKDMAHYLPALLTQAETAGYKGADGLAEVVAMLQILNSTTGSQEGANSSLSDLFFKMTSKQTVANMKDYGVDDLQGELDRRKASGMSPVQAFMTLLDETLKGDDKKITDIFGDKEAYLAALGLAKDTTLEARKKAYLASEGGVAKDAARFSSDDQATVDRFGNSWDNFVMGTGKMFANLGGAKVLEGLGNLFNALGSIGSTGTVGDYKDDASKAGVDINNAVPGGIPKTGGIPYVPGGMPKPSGGTLGIPGMNVPSDLLPPDLKSKTTSELKTGLADPAKDGMANFNEALIVGGQVAKGTAAAIAADIKSQLSFTATPTISPRVTAPVQKSSATGAPASPGATPVNYHTYHINGAGNPSQVAARVQRAQDRKARMALAGALHDSGSGFA